MKKYLVIDSGGSKTAAILYGEDFCRLGACVAGSLRSNTTSDPLYEKHADAIISSLGLRGAVVEAVRGTYEDRFLDLLRGVCEIKSAQRDGEMELGLSAAGLFGDGVLALCGTGATVFARYNGGRYAAGGYGAAVSDEGSGYYIGRQALCAAIRDFEGRGPKTALTEALAAHFGGYGREDFRSSVFSIYTQSERSPVACVGKCVPAVIETAVKGDGTAKKILLDAGTVMGEMTAALIKKHALPADIPVAVSGSVWRANPLFYEGFVSVLRREPVIPVLEPVAGAVARAYFERYGKADIGRIAEEYPEFTYDVNKMK